MTAFHGLGHVGTRRIEETDEAEQAQVVLGILASVGRRGPVWQAPPGDREDAESLRGPAFEDLEDLGARRVVERDMVVGAADQRRPPEKLFGSALRVNREAAVLALVHRRHQAELRVETVHATPLVFAPRGTDVDAERARRLEETDLGRLATRVSGR